MNELDRIYQAFLPYLREQEAIDILYSEKAGYIWICAKCPEAAGAERLDTPEKLLEAVLYVMADETAFRPGGAERDPTYWRLTRVECEAVLHRAAGYLAAFGIDGQRYMPNLKQFLAEL
ncbi:MAG: hypothetical protein HFF17_02835 [Oscillospiraceae bacterium]|nr:hypothetical protein [Oscillospiraceae bacterium]